MAVQIETQGQLSEFLEILSRRRWQLALPALLVLALGTALAVLIPKKFLVSTQVEVRTVSVTSSSGREAENAPNQIRAKERIRKVVESLKVPAYLARDGKGRDGIYLIDATTGATSMIMPYDQITRPRDPDWSPDGRAIRYQEIRGKDVVILEREVGSEKTREIFTAPVDGTSPRRISPDGRLVGYIRDEPDGRSSTFMVMPIDRGTPTSVLSGGKLGFYWQWLPDSQGVLVTKWLTPDGEDKELWIVPLNGSPRRVNLDMHRSEDGGLAQIAPDGRHLAFVATAGEPGAEIWALENFLPAPARK